MALTREQLIANIDALEAQGAKPEEVQSYLDSLKTPEPPKQDLMSRIGRAYQEGRERTQSVKNPFLRGITALGESASTTFGTVPTEIIKSAVSPLTTSYREQQPTPGLGERAVNFVVGNAIQGIKDFPTFGGRIGASPEENRARGATIAQSYEANKEIVQPLVSLAGGALSLAGAGVAGEQAATLLSKLPVKKFPIIPKPKDSVKMAIESITPKPSELSKPEYEALVSKGKFSPKGTFKQPEYIVSDYEKDLATKYQNVLNNKDPIVNNSRILSEIADKDSSVGTYLKSRNAIYNKGELRNYLTQKLEPVTDITIPNEARLIKAKQDFIDSFIDSVPKSNMESLWQSRKAFDALLESKLKAFSGSSTLKKDIARGVRNGVQDFISEKTDDVTYKGLMRDMSELYNLQEAVLTKVGAEKGRSALMQWIKNNPVKAKILGYTTAGGIGFRIFNP